MFYSKIDINSKLLKVIPENIFDLLTPIGLAYWLMDDGYKSSLGFYFCTESFTLEENYKLKLILKNKFDLDCGVHKHTNGHRLYVFSTSKNKLLELVKPYFEKTMLYRIGL